MKNRIWLVAAALALFAANAMSQGTILGWGQKNQQPQSATSPVVPQVKVNVVGGIVASDTSGAPFLMDSDGYAKMVQKNPAMDANLTFASIISSTITAASADSSAILDTHRMRLGMLLIKANPSGGGTGTINRLAIQIRVHLNGQSDTSSTFAIYQYGATAVATAGALPDTIAFGHLVSGSTTTPWSGEFDIMATADRSGPVTGGSTNDFRSPTGIAIPLQSLFGRDSWAPYVSVRVRNITGPSCAVTVHLVGTPL